MAQDSNISELLEHLAEAHRALLAADPENAVYELGRAGQCLWRTANFEQVRNKAADYSSLWMEGETEHWENRVAVRSAYEKLKSHGINPKLPPGVRVIRGEIVFFGWRWLVGFLTWPLAALVVGVVLGHWLWQ